MTDPVYLELRGWRKIATKPNGYGYTHYWDHPEHQPDRRGAFTTTDAMSHQKAADNNGCDCVKPVEGE